MKKKISFIGFDLDGTLVDSHQAVYKCLKETLPKYVNDDVEKIIDIIFPLTMSQFPNYINFKNDNSYKLFREEFSELFDKKYYKTIKPMDYYLDLLNFCKSKYGEKNVFILTNRRKESALQVCKYFSITDIIGVEKIFSTKMDSTSNPKSNSLKHVRKLLYINNKLGYYVGDNVTDIDSAIDNNAIPLYISGKEPLIDITSKYNLINNINYFSSLYDLLVFLKV